MDVLEAAEALDPLPELAEPLLRRHRLTADEMLRMTEVGVLARDARVELIDGEVIDMASIGTLHYAAVTRLNHLLVAAVAERAIVSVQSPLRLSQYNEPEPDLVVLRPREDFYASGLPTGADAFLVIEVSDSSLAYDLQVKAPLYARHGVAELWVIDLPGQALRRCCQPQPDGWQQVTTMKRPGRVALPAALGGSLAEIDLGALF